MNNTPYPIPVAGGVQPPVVNMATPAQPISQLGIYPPVGQVQQPGAFQTSPAYPPGQFQQPGMPMQNMGQFQQPGVPMQGQPGLSQAAANPRPDGLEVLEPLQGLEVKQQLEMLEMLTNIETANKYDIHTLTTVQGGGFQILKAEEQSDECQRQFCGPTGGPC